MTHECLTRNVGQSTLWAIPSVHFRLCFAEEVNRLACKLRPTAIAVELGPAGAAAAVTWMRELGVGPSARVRVELPCMLALTQPNRRLHPSVRTAAERLQRATGRDLAELPPEVMHQLLGYSGLSVLYLSPTDSIIEAVRSSLELNVPIYGVDLEETADARRREILIEEPTPAPGRNFRSQEFAARNSRYAERQRDEIVDGRRDYAMAARLKTLLTRHERVLFVCGLAHWNNINRLLGSDDVRRAPVAPPSPDECRAYQRVVVHPQLAIHHLDALPVFAQVYERNRLHAGDAVRPAGALDRAVVFQQKLQSTYERYFGEPDSEQQLDRKLEDLEARRDFEQLLRNLCTVKLQCVPDLHSALVTAQGVMSEGFCRVFAEQLMEFPWANAGDFKDLALLAPAPETAGGGQRAEFVAPDGRRSRAFYVQTLPERTGISARIPLPWQWKSEPPAAPIGDVPSTGTLSNWVPIDHLTSAMTLQAMKLARDHAERSRSEVFEGSLLDGVDTKSTLRAVTRGDDRIYVRAMPKRRQAQPDKDGDGFPFVWIFRLVPDDQMSWKFSADSMSTLRSHVVDVERFDAVVRDWGRTLISGVIATGDERSVPELCQPGYEVKGLDRVGQLSFNPLPSVSRTAQWAESNDYQRSPIVSSASFPRVASAYRERFGIELRQFAWPVTLVQLGIPYATRAVTVVAPDGFTLPQAVYRQAASQPRPVEIRMVPLSFFPAHALRKITKMYWIPILGRTPQPEDLPIYPEHVMRHFGEDVKIYRRLIPKEWY